MFVAHDLPAISASVLRRETRQLAVETRGTGGRG
jgi:hypothetical protein